MHMCISGMRSANTCISLHEIKFRRAKSSEHLSRARRSSSGHAESSAHFERPSGPERTRAGSNGHCERPVEGERARATNSSIQATHQLVRFEKPRNLPRHRGDERKFRMTYTIIFVPMFARVHLRRFSYVCKTWRLPRRWPPLGDNVAEATPATLAPPSCICTCPASLARLRNSATSASSPRCPQIAAP